MTTETKTYNGWTNYETWNVALWIGNEEGSDRYWRERTQEAFDEADDERYFTRKERAAINLAEALKSEIVEANPLGGDASMFSDLLGAALSEVDWHEIANNWLEDVDESDDESDDDSDEEE